MYDPRQRIHRGRDKPLGSSAVITFTLHLLLMHDFANIINFSKLVFSMKKKSGLPEENGLYFSSFITRIDRKTDSLSLILIQYNAMGRIALAGLFAQPCGYGVGVIGSSMHKRGNST